MQQIIQLLSETFGRLDPSMQTFFISLAATMSWDLFKQFINSLVADPNIVRKIKNPGSDLEQIKIEIESRAQRRIGILNTGRNNRYLNNSFDNLDIGIKDEGEGTIAEGNKFL